MYGGNVFGHRGVAQIDYKIGKPWQDTFSIMPEVAVEWNQGTPPIYKPNAPIEGAFGAYSYSNGAQALDDWSD
jgi:hypothetical protein